MEIKERHCTGCDTTKPIEKFSRDKYDKSGYTYKCKKCRAKQQKEWVSKNPEKVKALNLKHRQNRKEYYSNPERKLFYRKKYIERNYNISYEEYELKQATQNNLCACCGEPETHRDYQYLSVDHNHSTGEVRDLLCNRCNRFIGWINEDTKILENMINYLNKHNESTIISR